MELVVDSFVADIKQKGYYYGPVIKGTELTNISKEMNDRIANNNRLKNTNDNFALLDQPYMIDDCLSLALSDEFLQFPFLFFGARPFYLGTCNLRRSFATQTPDHSTTLYHRDQNLGSLENTKNNFLKVFVYLTDVSEKNGPFTYVEGSNNSVLENTRQYRHTDKEINGLYLNCEKKLTGKFGQVIVADTTGLHKGTKVKDGSRDMLTMIYTTIEEKGASNFFIKKKMLDSLIEQKREICKYLTVVE